jgi:hypothetical protein
MRLLGPVGGLVLCGLLLAGCAGSAEPDAQRAATGFLDAAGRDDGEAACALLTPRTRTELSTSEGQSCAEALPADRIQPGTVRSVQVWSGWAQVDTDANTLFLTEFDDGWRVSAAGCTPADESEPYRCVVGG